MEVEGSPQDRTPRRRRRKKEEKKTSDAEESTTAEVKTESPVEEPTITTPVRRGRRRLAPPVATEAESAPATPANAPLPPPPAASAADKDKCGQGEEEPAAESDLTKLSGKNGPSKLDNSSKINQFC